MKRLKSVLLLLSVTLAITISCSDDFLETKPLTEVSEVDLWGDPALVRSFVNNIYLNIPEPFLRGRLSSNVVDEADYRGNTGALNFNNGVITQDQTPAWISMYYNKTWEDLYKNVRNCNTVLENIENIPFENAELKDKTEGEVRFLRAYSYHELVAAWGGVPLITEVYGLGSDFEAPRDSYEDCINFIVSECDLAANLLPEVQDGADIGRATKGGALALKSRVLLYAASELHNSTVLPSFTHPELLGYQGGDRGSRWTAAKNAAKEVIDLGLYSLYKADPAPGDSIAQNIKEYFLTPGYTEEDIWLKPFLEEKSEQYLGLYGGPNGYHGWGVNAPIGDIVDAYEMADGSKFDWTDPVQASMPYENRDQRFYAHIFYEGAKWRKRPEDAIGRDPDGVIQVGTYEVWNNETSEIDLRFGLDTRSGGIEEWNGSYTGYYLRKFIDPAKDLTFIEGGGVGFQGIPYRYFRYAEILLNYAEACIALGQDAEARQYINMVRRRAGQPDLTESGDDLIERYRNERRIELSFEEHRIHDVRRWAIGPEAYHPVLRAKVIYELLPDKTTATVPTITHEVFQERSWVDKAYFMPIPRDEISKNSLLVQNPGY
ncbi:RagB/SusD family nutrient uptake outer membrane protein [Pricia sp. S334]|uniref:RagB/SusD family nutrient uptake outer membrane protein n=1 Tax=Pricia mediterranea TaxID=3076079 RepID=A0ABU3L4F5_9FLAO|nr:RagB/SusD family nutrient uptake outer membrane protein [Pricia sp. S334]MDT7828268.1 RagB/SusD family nutrient uptake outer membrane protein [Pricia sp. S334]